LKKFLGNFSIGVLNCTEENFRISFTATSISNSPEAELVVPVCLVTFIMFIDEPSMESALILPLIRMVS